MRREARIHSAPACHGIDGTGHVPNFRDVIRSMGVLERGKSAGSRAPSSSKEPCLGRGPRPCPSRPPGEPLVTPVLRGQGRGRLGPATSGRGGGGGRGLRGDEAARGGLAGLQLAQPALPWLLEVRRTGRATAGAACYPLAT